MQGKNRNGNAQCQIRRWAIVLTICLSACGGGGGSSSSPTAPVTPPAPPNAQISTLLTGSATTGDDIIFSSGTTSSILSYTWNFGDGQVGSGSQVIHAFAVPGTYSVELLVTDTRTSLTGKATTTVVVEPPAIRSLIVPPLGGEQPRLGETTSFTGFGQGQEPLRYEWTLDGIRLASQSKYVDITFAQKGPHTLELRVTDAANRSAVASTTVAVGEPRPHAYISAYSSPVPITQQLSVAAQGNAEGITYEWNFGDGTPTTSPSLVPWAQHQYGAVGTYVITLTARNSDGLSVTATTSVTVVTPPPAILNFANDIPYPLFDLSALPVDHEYTFAIDATGDAPLRYQLDFGDGDTVNEPFATHTFKSPGKHVVRATVTDSSGRTATRSSELQIDPVRYQALYGTAPAPALQKGLGPQAAIRNIRGLACSQAGELVIASDQVLWKLQADQRVVRYAGIGGSIQAARGGSGTEARFTNNLSALKSDRLGNLYAWDYPAMHKIATDGLVSILAGFADHMSPFVYQRRAHAPDSSGRIYFVNVGPQWQGQLIQRFDPVTQSVEDVAGSISSTGRIDGPGASARFLRITDLAFDTDGSLMVAEDMDSAQPQFGRAIRRISPSGQVTTVMQLPPTSDGGRFDLHLADNGKMYAVTVVWVFELTGNSYTAWSVDFNAGESALCGGRLVIDFPANGREYLGSLDLSTGMVSRLLPGPGNWAHPAMPFSVLAADPNGYAYVLKGYGVGKMDATGAISEWVGSFSTAGNADGTLAQARFGRIDTVSWDKNGTLWMIDRDAQTVRKVDAGGTASTVPGTFETDPLISASSNGNGAAFVGPKYLYRLSPDGSMTKTTLASDLSDALFPALSNRVSAAMDSKGALFFGLACRVVKLDSQGQVTVLAGDPHPITDTNTCWLNPSGVWDGMGAQARLGSIRSLTIDIEDNLYVLDQPLNGNVALLRKITPDGNVQTLSALAMTMPDQSGAKVAHFYPWFGGNSPSVPPWVVVLPSGELLFTAGQGTVFQSLGFATGVSN